MKKKGSLFLPLLCIIFSSQPASGMETDAPVIACIIPSYPDIVFWSDIENSMYQKAKELNAELLMLYTKHTNPSFAMDLNEALSIAIYSDVDAIITSYTLANPETDDMLAAALEKEIPVIMVTAKGAEFDKVKGLDAGADDYITKPFGMMEFLARVKAVLRRSGQKQGEKELHCGSLTILVERHEVQENGRLVELTLKEFEVLKYLVENKGIVLTRDQLLGHVWGYDFDGETRTVDVHIRSLRQKLGDAGALIETVRGVGYRIGELK